MSPFFLEKLKIFIIFKLNNKGGRNGKSGLSASMGEI